jgi:glycosyltransferase involved in cell wall biosynthesis
MRIAILASNFIRLPPDPSCIPQGYSGAPEHIMHVLTESLVARGHEVTLFASGDSRTSARLVSVTDASTSMDSTIGVDHHVDYENLLVSRCYQMARTGIFDVIHSMVDVRSLMFAPFVSIPTVCTLHSPLVGIRKDIFSKNPDTQWYVSISNSQRMFVPQLRYADTVYHGINTTEFSFGEGRGENLLFVGRMMKEKGVEDALEAAKKSALPLSLFGEPPKYDAYWQTVIAENIDPTLVTHRGFVDKERLIQEYQKSRALLFPIQWEEPFGLVMIEAMSCGTPVIAYNRGSVPEVVKDGITGFIIDPDDEERQGRGTWVIKKQGIDGLVEAISRIGEIKRRACRRHVEEHFTVERMVEGYEKVYAKILTQS